MDTRGIFLQTDINPTAVQPYQASVYQQLYDPHKKNTHSKLTFFVITK